MRKSFDNGFIAEVIVRLLLLGVFLVTEELPPFSHEIQPEELWLYKFHPVKTDRVPTRFMFSIALFTPLLVIFLFSSMKKGGKGDVKEASLAVTLTLVLNGIFTNAIKLAVGSIQISRNECVCNLQGTTKVELAFNGRIICHILEKCLWKQPSLNSGLIDTGLSTLEI